MLIVVSRNPPAPTPALAGEGGCRELSEVRTMQPVQPLSSTLHGGTVGGPGCRQSKTSGQVKGLQLCSLTLFPDVLLALSHATCLFFFVKILLIYLRGRE